MRSASARGPMLAMAGMLGVYVQTGCWELPPGDGGPGADACPSVDAAPPVDGPSLFTVRGIAAGMREPLNIWLEHSGGRELLSILEDGPFAFTTALADGASYRVVFVGEPPCAMDGAIGIVRGRDPTIELVCGGVLGLSGLALSGPTAPDLEIDPDRMSYEADVSILQQTVRVTATAASPQVSITVAGMPVTSGEPSEPLPLNLGENSMDVVVTHPSGIARTYRLLVRRAVELAEHAYSRASNVGATDWFGYSISLWGDTLAVGAPNESSSATGVDGDQDDDSARESGAVYVFRRDGTDWVQEAYIKASNTGIEDYFGARVALWGDTLAVTAPREDSSATGVNGDQDDDSCRDSGAVYIFRRHRATWVQEAYIKASNTGRNDHLGWGLALWDDTLAVGAHWEGSSATGVDGDQDNDDAPYSGAVYVFRRDGRIWAQEAYVKASNTGHSDHFGWSLALWEDTLAVGAIAEDSSATGVDGNQYDNAVQSSGAVYVFRRDGRFWGQEAYVKASNTGTRDAFGYSVALWGDTLAVSARREDSSATGVNGDQADDSAVSSGAVYVFRNDGTAWAQEAYVKASNTDANDWFGDSVALWGDILAVGAPGEDSSATGVNGDQGNHLHHTGAVYVFSREGTSWTQNAYVKASNTDYDYYFGRSVALWNHVLAVGSPEESSNASGATYVFH